MVIIMVRFGGDYNEMIFIFFGGGIYTSSKCRSDCTCIQDPYISFQSSYGTIKGEKLKIVKVCVYKKNKLKGSINQHFS